MARDQKKEDSVYDFLYVDNRRLAHFLSQFSQYGHLTALTRAVSETDTGGGGVNIHVVKLDTTQSEQTTQTRQFDTQWVDPLLFLDQAGERGLIKRGPLSSARIGTVHLISGKLAIFDLSVIKVMWKMPAVRQVLMVATGMKEEEPQGNRAHRRANPKENATPDVKFSAVLDLIEDLPHALVASMYDGADTVWATLRDEGLCVPASNLLLKHGAKIAGTWNIVGVIDAKPSAAESSEDTEGLDVAVSAMGTLGSVVAALSPAVKNMLGRPDTSYGVTPLLIFREVAS